MVVDPDLGAERNVVANRQAAGEPDLGREQQCLPMVTLWPI
jgi:hypothetical protein